VWRLAGFETLPDFASLTPETLEAICRDAMAECDAALDAIAAIPAGERTAANTLLALEEAAQAPSRASGMFAFMSYVSPDAPLREKARDMDTELDKYFVGLSFREDLYAALREFAATPEAAALEGEDARFLQFELRDFRRNGLELEPEKRAELRRIFDRLVEVGVAFRTAIDEWDDGLELALEQLAGLPDAFIDGLRKTTGNDRVERYRVSLDYPELHPFMANAEDASLRRDLFERDQRKGGPGNVALLEEAIALRDQAAAILGYESWAAYVVEERMAGSPRAVDAFFASLRDPLQAKGERDLEAMRALKTGHTGDETVNIWDWRYYHNRAMREGYEVDEFAVAEYFPLEACLRGLFDATQALLGVRFERNESAPRWHPDVDAFDVFKAGGTEPFARFYMDLFPRSAKYGHAAAFTLQRGRRLTDGSYQLPISAIVANFTKPSASAPSLLRHSELVTLWHEFGHILHQVMTRAARSRFSGTATERDFVEAPSQMLEHWCWEPAILQSFARHYQTGEPIPTDLVDRMIAARNLNSGIIYLRQLYFGVLDFAYHTPGFDGDSTATARDLHALTGFPFPPGTHFQSGFGHLFGYDAGYYGYLWSQVFGDDMYTRFAPDPLSGSVGAEYRRLILERGGSVDGGAMVREFLGREPGRDAFLREIGLAD
jgi:thimet oligopeptidase